MKNKKLISELANIRFGVNVKRGPSGQAPCLQGKDFDKYGNLDESALTFIPVQDCSDKDWLKPGEVLFAAKGTRNYALVWKRADMDAVASATFFVLSVSGSEILPEYLAWYLMSANSKRHFESRVKKSTIPTISKKVFNELEVDIPSIEEQKKIVAINELWMREQQLINELTEKKNRLIFNGL